ncbi:MAG: Coq4 family protein [Nitriliruptorales bacterium]|nr:Coq4 family protein [Nitriliruptorales bacterium]
MTTTTAEHRPIRRNWKRAVATSSALLIPTRRVAELMEFTCAVSGPALEREFQRFVATEEGRRLLAEKPDLPGMLADREALATLPPNSLAAAYLDFTDLYRFDAKVFEEIHNIPAMGERLGWDEDTAWLMARGLQMHDLWHVLNDYGPDYAGEGGNVAFTYAQIPALGPRILTWIFRLFHGGVGRRRMRAFLREAEARGRAATQLTIAPWEELLGQDIDDVRQQLGILPTAVAHPDGIPYSTFQYGLGRKNLDRAVEQWEPRGGRGQQAVGA